MTYPTSKRRNARSVYSIPIVSDNLRAVLNRSHYGPQEMSEAIGKCRGYMYVTFTKARINYFALDAIATELGMEVEDLFYEVVDMRKWLDLRAE